MFGRRQQGEALKEHTEALREMGQELAACREQTDLSGRDIERQLKRHSEAIEDLLEQQGTQETVIERYENQIREGRERENMLLNLLCRYQEEFGLIEEKLRDMDRQHAEDWTDQLSLFRKSLENELRQCAIEETGRTGESVDYRYHEILDVEDTAETALDSTALLQTRLHLPWKSNYESAGKGIQSNSKEIIASGSIQRYAV